MFVSTKALVLHATKYSDTSLIVKLYTEKFGTQSFIVKNAFSPRSRQKVSFFAPLTLLELQFDDHKLNQLMFIKEVRCYRHYRVIPFDMVRSSLLMFYAELLYKLLFEAGEDSRLFAFLEQELCNLDEISQVRPDCHIFFMLQLADLMGFAPIDNYDEKHCYFSLEQSSFQTQLTLDSSCLSAELSAVLGSMMRGERNGPAHKKQRNELLNALIDYFKLHNDQLRHLDSLDILRQIS